MSGFTLYLIYLSGNIHIAGSILLIITSIILVMLMGIYIFSEDEGVVEYIESEVTKFKILIIVFIISSLITIFVPTTKELATIIVIPKLVTEESMEKIPQLSTDLLDLANEKIKELKDK
jgi:hypothetical protein